MAESEQNRGNMKKDIEDGPILLNVGFAQMIEIELECTCPDIHIPIRDVCPDTSSVYQGLENRRTV